MSAQLTRRVTLPPVAAFPDEDVREMIVQLLPQPPAAIAVWLALHVRRLEARFAS